MRSVYLKAGVLTAIIFLLGLSIGFWLDWNRSQEVRSQLEELKIQADEARVGLVFYQAFRDDPAFCPLFELGIQEQIKRVGALGDQLENLHQTNKLDDSYFNFRKQYVLFNTELYLNALQLKKNCNANAVTIAYFYPDSPCVDCARQANELLALKNACPQKVWLFALPVDVNVSVVNMLARKYGATTMPSLAVNEKTFSGFQTASALKTSFPELNACS